MSRILVGEVMPGGDEENLAGSWANVLLIFVRILVGQVAGGD
jgi:hypothetical protein